MNECEDDQIQVIKAFSQELQGEFSDYLRKSGNYAPVRSQPSEQTEVNARRKPPDGTRTQLNGERRTVQNSPCHSCGAYGHWRNRCPLRQRGESGNNDRSDQNQENSRSLN